MSFRCRRCSNLRTLASNICIKFTHKFRQTVRQTDRKTDTDRQTDRQYAYN